MSFYNVCKCMNEGHTPKYLHISVTAVVFHLKLVSHLSLKPINAPIPGLTGESVLLKADAE